MNTERVRGDLYIFFRLKQFQTDFNCVALKWALRERKKFASLKVPTKRCIAEMGARRFFFLQLLSVSKLSFWPCMYPCLYPPVVFAAAGLDFKKTRSAAFESLSTKDQRDFQSERLQKAFELFEAVCY